MSSVAQLRRVPAQAVDVAETRRHPLPPTPAGLRDGVRPSTTVLRLRPDQTPTSWAPCGSPDTDAELIPRISGIARSVAQGALEVLGGSRPLQQLARWLDPENYERLQLRTNLVRCIDPAPAGGPGSSPRTAHRHVVIRSARVCRVDAEVFEASVVAFDQKRVRAVALRIERRRGVWRVTALEIG